MYAVSCEGKQVNEQTNQALLRCKKCDIKVTRSVLNGEWCHINDEYVLESGNVQVRVFQADHEPDPDFIDIKESSERSEPVNASPPVPGQFPFGAIR